MLLSAYARIFHSLAVAIPARAMSHFMNYIRVSPSYPYDKTHVSHDTVMHGIISFAYSFKIMIALWFKCMSAA